MRGRFTGAKPSTEATGHSNVAVEERSVRLRRCIEKCAGGIRSANADMSNDKGSEKLPRRKSKVSCATLIDAGLVGT